MTNLSYEKDLFQTEDAQIDEHNTPFIDLCSGVGAGRLGLENEGFKCLGFSEINEKVIKTYKSLHKKNEVSIGDLTLLDYQKIPDADLLIAGFPCQTFSIVGKRQGLKDDRGQIIFSISKILKEKNIKYFILENVKGLTSINNGNVLKDIIKLLNNAGYHVHYSVLNSFDYGVPQMRERIYFVGIRKDLIYDCYNFPQPLNKNYDLSNYLVNDSKEYILNKDSKKYNTFQKYLNNKYNKGKYNIDKILKDNYTIIDTRQSDLRLYYGKVPTLRTGRHGILYTKNNELRYISGKEAFLLQGFSKKHTHKLNNQSNTVLLSQAGNAMTVDVMQAIAKSLKSIIMQNKGEK